MLTIQLFKLKCCYHNFFNYFFEKGFSNFFCSLYILQMTTKSCEKVASKFFCEKCDYFTSKKSSYDKHTLTAKHMNATNCNENATKSCEKVAKSYYCSCGKKYSHHSSLWKHQKMCNETEETNDNNTDADINDKKIIIELLKSNKELKDLVVEQNKTMIEMANKMGSTVNNTNCNNNNTNNFNLQFFLNEQCKDALNIMDFINQLQVKTSDLDMVGRIGYSEGISKIFIRGLKELDVFKRPIHCSDLKREVLYVKDKDAWEKDSEENKKMKTAIKYIAAKNFKQINEWKEENPESNNYDTKKHMDYHQIVIHSMGGATAEEDENNYNKIIRNVSKEVVIKKEKEK
jgi:hypothetical protein